MTLDLNRQDTICAPATGHAPAALAVVRVSGPRAHAIRDAVFRPARDRTPGDFVATLGHVVDGDALIDEALCTSFPAGRSYTGEESFELSVHGGPARVRATLAALQRAGCRLATPGELTLRAVLTGRLDLTAAEAVADVIGARSAAAAEVALRNLAGGLKARVAPTRATIVDVLAELEARLDFPDEDLGPGDAQRLTDALSRATDALTELLDGASLGRRLIAGARAVLWGAPNAGKSTLLNALADEERALVHDAPGTTRDVLEVEVVIRGVPVTLVDVAGVRALDDAHAVEALGIERAEAERERADLVLHVVDGSAPVTREPLEGAVLVHTKADLGAPEAPGGIVVCAPEGRGLTALKDAIAARLGASEAANEALITRARQHEEILTARDALTRARDALAAGEVHEVVASELRQAGAALDRLLGAELDEEVLDAIFSRFCIGK
jgi:tRNA modification GTPase